MSSREAAEGPPRGRLDSLRADTRRRSPALAAAQGHVRSTSDASTTRPPHVPQASTSCPPSFRARLAPTLHRRSPPSLDAAATQRGAHSEASVSHHTAWAGAAPLPRRARHPGRSDLRRPPPLSRASPHHVTSHPAACEKALRSPPSSPPRPSPRPARSHRRTGTLARCARRASATRSRSGPSLVATRPSGITCLRRRRARSPARPCCG